MRPASFDYHKAQSIDHAVELLSQFGEEARPLAGGQSLVPMMNLRLARPAHLIDINGLGIDGINFDGDIMRVGALARHENYLSNEKLAQRFPAFREAVSYIGHPTIRRHGTLGGSISHADPTAELPAICLLYEATITARSVRGERAIAAGDFFIGAYTTALEPDELVVAVEFPLPGAWSSSAFVEASERRGDFATVLVGVAFEHADGAITKAVVVNSGASLAPARAPIVEMHLVGRRIDEPASAEAGAIHADAVDPIANHIASAEFRRGLVAELTARAVSLACERASVS